MLQVQTKSTFIILIVLLIGFLLGILSARFLISHRIHDFQGMHHKEGFIHLFEEMIDPHDGQADKVRIILESHFDRFADMGADHMMEVKVIMDSLRIELEPYLTTEQIDKLTRQFDRRRRPGGPPGRGRPPHDRLKRLPHGDHNQ